jgi:hypothetical protein
MPMPTIKEVVDYLNGPDPVIEGITYSRVPLAEIRELEKSDREDLQASLGQLQS